MKSMAIASFVLATSALVGCRPPETVAYVDLERYLGKWYEIASYPQRFQRNCTATTATYAWRDAESISVLNECRKGNPDGPYDAVEGYAVVADLETNAKLKVYFGPIPGDYWVIDLDPESDEGEPYRWAVVGSPLRAFLWILSREPILDEDILDGIFERLEEQGYDLGKLEFTLHAGN